jgi:hypothetical protein
MVPTWWIYHHSMEKIPARRFLQHGGHQGELAPSNGASAKKDDPVGLTADAMRVGWLPSQPCTRV